MKLLNLCPADALFLPDDYPIEFVFLYRARIGTERMRVAVRELSEAFWPVFGDFRGGTIVYRPCAAEATLEETTVAGPLAVPDAGEPPWRVVAALRAPKRPRALCSIHVTQFNQATAIAIRTSHLVADGYSYFHFVSMLARMTLSLGAEHEATAAFSMPAPTHDRAVLRAARIPNTGDEPTPVEHALQIQVDRLSRALVHGTVKDASRSTGVRVSINDVLCAITVKRLWERAPHAFARELAVTIPIDVRAQIAAYGPSYFGNAVWYHRVPFEREQVACMELAQIAATIRQSMPIVTAESYTQHLDELVRTQTPKVYDPSGGCLVTNMSHVPLSLLDFGAGAAACTIPIMKEKHSAIVMASGSDYILRLAVD